MNFNKNVIPLLFNGKMRVMTLLLTASLLISGCSSGAKQTGSDKSSKSGDKKAVQQKATVGKEAKAGKDGKSALAKTADQDNNDVLPSYITNEKDPAKRAYLEWRFQLLRAANKLDIVDYTWQKTFTALAEEKLTEKHAVQSIEGIDKELAEAATILEAMKAPEVLKKEHQAYLNEARLSMVAAVKAWQQAREYALQFLNGEKKPEISGLATQQIKLAKSEVRKAAQASLQVKKALGFPVEENKK